MCFTKDDWYYDLLQHGPAVDEAGTTGEVKPVRPLRNPELHVAFRPGRHRT